MDVQKLREDFPALSVNRGGGPPIYFDSACVTLRPRQVIDKVIEYYEQYPGCHGRTTHYFGRRTTEEYVTARKKVQRYIGDRKPEEVVFTKNTTEGINIVARGVSFRPGEEILSSEMEHTSNLTPWQIVSAEKGVKRRFFPYRKDLTFDIQACEDALNEKVRVVNVHHVSNVTGVEHPIREICKMAHDYGALVVVDGAQATGHKKVNVRRLGADFYSFSGHKMLGPSGTGVLYGRKELLDELPQLISGGETVRDTTLTTHNLAPVPDKFEAGLQDYAGIIGLGAAVDYMRGLDLDALERHERQINGNITEWLLAHRVARIIGPQEARRRPAILNMILDGHDPFDIAKVLDEASGIMLRAGKHCLHSWYNKTGTSDSMRASFHCYNTLHEADVFIDALGKFIGA